MRDDGLTNHPDLEIPARQLLGTVCVAAGVECPMFGSASEARAILETVRTRPAASIRLTSDADRISHYSVSATAPAAKLQAAGVFDRKRDLDVLQRLGLVPGDTRRARYLYELLFDRIDSPVGICASDTFGWEGCSFASNGSFERVRSSGVTEIVPRRSDACKARARALSAERIRSDAVLHVRPHHLMCMSCWIGNGRSVEPRPDDTLDLLWSRILADPAVEIVLIEGNCEACYCCDGFDEQTFRCVHPGGLIRDFKKDLDVFERIGLMPGTRMNARSLLRLIYERVESTRDICGFGTGVATSHEWSVCGGADGHPGYAEARASVPTLLD